MVKLNFDTTAITDTSFGPIAPGEYDGEIVAAEERMSGAGNRYLSIQVQIDSKGSVWDNLNLWHPKPNVVEIALDRLKQYKQATDTALDRAEFDTDEWLARTVRVRVGIKKDDPSRNEILQILKKTGVSPGPVETASTPAWRG